MGLKVRLYPDKDQLQIINQNIGNARFVKNYFLDYADENKVYKYNDWSKVLTDLKKDENYSWLKKSDKFALQNSLRDLKRAFTNFFEKRAKFPKHHKKGRNDSYRTNFTNNNIVLEKKQIKLPKLGYVECKYNINFKIEKIVSVTVSRKGNKYYASIVYEKEEAKPILNKKDYVGLDMGVRKLITTSDNEMLANIGEFKKIDDKIRRLHREVSKKKLGSNNRLKAIYELNKAYDKRNNIINDLIHKATTYIVKSYKNIFIEDLDIKQLVGIQEKRYNKRKLIATSLGRIRRCLEYKAIRYDSQIFLVDRFYASTKTCSNCGNTYEVGDSEVYECPHCHLKIDRDYNAAINILNKGLEMYF